MPGNPVHRRALCYRPDSWIGLWRVCLCHRNAQLPPRRLLSCPRARLVAWGAIRLYGSDRASHAYALSRRIDCGVSGSCAVGTVARRVCARSGPQHPCLTQSACVLTTGFSFAMKLASSPRCRRVRCALAAAVPAGSSSTLCAAKHADKRHAPTPWRTFLTCSLRSR